jgi:hypothetical protein
MLGELALGIESSTRIPSKFEGRIRQPAARMNLKNAHRFSDSPPIPIWHEKC